MMLALVLLLAGVLPGQDFGTDVHTRANPQNGARADANAAMEAGEYAKALKLLLPLEAWVAKRCSSAL